MKIIKYCILVILISKAFSADHKLTQKSSCNLIGAAAKTRDFALYSELMDAAMLSKTRRILPFLSVKPSSLVVDVGTGTGTLAATIALNEPLAKVIGVDIQKEMIERANKKFGAIPNLKFELGNAHDPYAVEADAVVMATVMHEIYSYSGDSYGAVDQALQTAAKSLKKGGTLVIKDFAQPENGAQIVHLVHVKSDIIEDNSFQKFASGFGFFGRRVDYKIIHESLETLTIETTLEAAYEYIFRKDYHQNWAAELRERYAYMFLHDIQRRLTQAGFEIKYARSEENSWILENRINGKCWLLDPATQKPIKIPDYDMIVVGTKK